MPSHKVLKSVANSLVSTFVGLLNYWRDDYVMGHLTRAAWITGATDIDFDLLSGDARPSPLLVDAVTGSLRTLHERFPDLVERSGSSMEFIADARFHVRVDPSTKRPHEGEALRDWPTPLVESPFTCSATILDERGKRYHYELSDWWFIEENAPENSTVLELHARGI